LEKFYNFENVKKLDRIKKTQTRFCINGKTVIIVNIVFILPSSRSPIRHIN